MSAAVLLAEPEPTVAGFLERHLTDDGFAVVKAEAGDEALALAERARPDVVLLGTELDVCRRLREVWGFRALGRTRTLDSHASRLRRKLGTASETPYVLNEWGVGYRLMLPA